jgi:AcrR family transcriptional regulator
MILDAVAEMLRRDPKAPLTMARAAESVGASPMSLYRYFGDRDSLLVAVTRHVMREADSDAPLGAAWQERLRAWMHAVYGRAVSHPQLFEVAASGESLAWLTCSAQLAAIFEDASFVDDGDLASAIYLVGTVTLGQAMVAAASGEDMSLPRLHATVGLLTPEEAERVGPLLPHFVALGTSGFDVVVEWTVVAVSDMVRDRSRKAKVRPRAL